MHGGVYGHEYKMRLGIYFLLYMLLYLFHKQILATTEYVCVAFYWQSSVPPTGFNAK